MTATFARPGAQLEGGLWLGANYWSGTGGPFMWRDYDDEVVRAELRVLREHGLTLTRSFLFWPDFQPAPTPEPTPAGALTRTPPPRSAGLIDTTAQEAGCPVELDSPLSAQLCRYTRNPSRLPCPRPRQ